jgi:Fe-S-cluster-containing dehydrogenase component
MTQFGMVIDLERCMGCRACQMACKMENDTPRGVFWMHVFRFEEGEYPETEQGFLPRPCLHCSDAPCEKVCPTEARFTRDNDGIVLTDYNKCIGCRYCEVACPYGVNYLQWRQSKEGQYGYGDPDVGADDFGSGSLEEEIGGAPPWRDPVHDETYPPRDTPVSGGRQPVGMMGKCTFCVHRQEDDERRGSTACEQSCIANAIHFGDMDDPESDPRQHLRKKQGSSTFRLLEESGADPNVIYVGDEPSEEAHVIEGADTFKDPDEAIRIEKQLPGEPSWEVTE